LSNQAEEPLGGAISKPGVGTFFHEGVEDALVDGLVLQHLALVVDEYGDGHAPRALAR
jgi:hypothetical protein